MNLLPYSKSVRYAPRKYSSAISANIFSIEFLGVLVGALVLFRDAFSAAIKSYFGIGLIWFLPDIMMCFSMVTIVITHASSRLPAFGVMVLAVTLSCLNGYFLTRSPTAVVSGVKLFLPLAAGFFLGSNGALILRQRKFLWVMFIIISCGVIYNSYYDFPWKEEVIIVNGVAREISRMWWDGEEVRIAGLGADSTLTGFLIMLVCLALSIHQKLVIRLLLYASTIAVVRITTSKTPLLILWFFLFLDGTISFAEVFGFSRLKIFRSLFWLVIGFSLVVPFIAVGYGQFFGYDHVSLESSSSFIDRATSSWILPHIRIAKEFPLAWIFGMGIGPVGPAIYFSEQWDLFVEMNQLDNFVFALYLMFGIVGPLCYIYYLYKFSVQERSILDIEIFYGLVLYGITVMGFASTTFLFVLGALLSPYNWSTKTSIVKVKIRKT